jgi:hypothetical protein
LVPPVSAAVPSGMPSTNAAAAGPVTRATAPPLRPAAPGRAVGDAPVGKGGAVIAAVPAGFFDDKAADAHARGVKL